MKIKNAILFLERFELPVDIGVHDFEVGKPQRVLVDVKLFLPKAKLSNGDDLKNGIDYDYLRTGIRGIAAGARFNTQEAFCLEILRLIFRESTVLEAIVWTRKTDVYPDAASVGCQIHALANELA